jgi:hypothetical protein
LTNDSSPDTNPASGTFQETCWLELDSGRMVRLYKLNQSLTYGSLGGIPDKETNNSKILSALAEAKHLSDNHCVLISPDRHMIPHEELPWYFAEDGETIPSVICIGQFESSKPAKDASKDCSLLTAVWFQDEFGLPTKPEILERLRAIDWDELAVDVGW